MTEFVDKVQYIKDITRMESYLKGMEKELKSFKKEFTDFKEKEFGELKNTLGEIQKRLFETNGGRSMADRLYDNEKEINSLREKLGDVEDKLNSIEKQRVRKLQRWYDTFWNWVIKVGVAVVLFLLSYILGTNSGLFANIWKIVKGF